MRIMSLLPFTVRQYYWLVKCKTGDLTDVNNYRAVVLSNSITKVIEHLLYNFIESQEAADEYQVGFRKNHSTAICTHIFKETVNYYIVKMVVTYLLVSLTSLKLLTMLTIGYWYSNQQMSLQWQNISSAYFNISNGVRQR